MPTQLAPKCISWASILDANAREQAIRTSGMPFVFPHLALMPDAHLGKGATVGSVIPTLGAIIPAAVGVDIGCGMIAVRTAFTVDEVRAAAPLRRLRTRIERLIPLSAGHHNRTLDVGPHTRRYLDELTALAEQTGFDPARYGKNWPRQLGSLGSGNHFIEVTADETGTVWLFLHSGSRGVGNRIAQFHIEVAQHYAERNCIQLPDRDLAYLVEGTHEFDRYIEELRWAQRFALLNRREMMDRVELAFAEHMGAAIDPVQTIQCHHNYTARETHWGKPVWVSRKGAIDAHEGVDGLLPGSMGTASYVVRGKGNPVALHSSPHGAGREHSRTAARKLFTREQLRERMAGIEYRDTDAFIDEIPDAYKPIDVVMRDAADLVEIRHTLHQLVNVKGD
ncbi:MAG TPA: RtcB family protein [Microlunatus sp.]